MFKALITLHLSNRNIYKEHICFNELKFVIFRNYESIRYSPWSCIKRKGFNEINERINIVIGCFVMNETQFNVLS